MGRTITLCAALMLALCAAPIADAGTAKANKPTTAACKRAKTAKAKAKLGCPGKRTAAQATKTTATPTSSNPASATAHDASTPASGGSPTAAPEASPTPLRIGLVANAQGWGDKAGQRLNAVADRSGVKWLREQFLWSVVQPTARTWDWSRYDLLMTAAAQRGVHILPMLLDTPSWAGSTWSSFPGSTAGYAAFTAAVSARYGPGGTFWATHPSLDSSVATTWVELWNEPYYPYFAGGAYDPPGYARLVKASVIAGRAANPKVKYLMAEETTGRMVGGAWKTWYDALYDAVPDLGDYFDGVAVHPYGADFSAPRDGTGDQFRRFDLIHQALVRHGDGDKPFWITELGYSTCPGGDPSGGDGCVTEARQAALLQQAYDTLRSDYPYVRALFAYRMIDDVGAGDPADGEQWYGLLRRDGTPKPAWAVFQRMLADTTGAGLRRRSRSAGR